MRGLHLPDLLDALRAVRACDLGNAQATAERIVAGARLADRYRKRLGRAHPVWGNGSLGQAARSQPLAPWPPRLDRASLIALRTVIEALLVPADHRADGRVTRRLGKPARKGYMEG